MTSVHRLHRLPKWVRWLAVFAVWLGAPAGWSAIQFDVFPGYDTVVRSGGWFPITFELFNDGPGFDGIIEVTVGQMGALPQRYALELPTNTRKRVVMPAFSGSPGFVEVNARLIDPSGKLLVEKTGLRLQQVAWEGFLLAGAPASFSGMPAFPEGVGRQNELQPRAVRLDQGQRLESFPDNPITLEGLNAIYLNSAKALELKDPQVDALLAWVHAGGHLIVAIDQPGDVGATVWLKDILPATIGGLANKPLNGELQRWLGASSGAGRADLQYVYQPPPTTSVQRNERAATRDPFLDLDAQPSFDQVSLPLVELTPRSGRVLVTAGGSPLIVCASRGRGLVTVLAFNPERDPVKGWKHRPWMWARLAGVPREMLQKDNANVWGGRSTDAVFGAMIETRQVRKLPVGVLLLLLVVYLVVIGPLDQWWLKKINRPMLTWITFPAYVALFSLLIYYIGFRLRAGNSEWNELHIVDILPRGGESVLRGRAFTSLYSPANQNYRVATDVALSTLRPESQGLWGNNNDSGRLAVRRKARGIEADVYVPVWTSQMNVSDWQETGSAPLQGRREGPTLTLANLRGTDLTNVLVMESGKLHRVGAIPAGGTVRVDLAAETRETPAEFVQNWSASLHTAATQRNEVFGSGGGERIDDWAGACSALSLTSLIPAEGSNNGRDLVWPAGLDLAPVLSRGDVLVLAWLPNETLIPPMNRFTALRHQSGTLLRLVVPNPR